MGGSRGPAATAQCGCADAQKVGVPPGEIVDARNMGVSPARIVYVIARMRGRQVFPGQDCVSCNVGLEY